MISNNVNKEEPLRVIIVDDEPLAVQTLSEMIREFCPGTEILATTTNPKTAIEILNQSEFDLLFLDINMPMLDGFDLLHFFESRTFDVIFVTASENHAIQAFKADASDYLLKPINIVELVDAVAKVRKRRMKTKDVIISGQFSASSTKKKIALPTNSGMMLVCKEDIISFKANEMLTELRLFNGKTVWIYKSLGQLEEDFRDNNFFRSHRSYIINLNHIQRYELSAINSQVWMLDGSEAPISRRNKEEFLNALQKLGWEV